MIDILKGNEEQEIADVNEDFMMAMKYEAYSIHNILSVLAKQFQEIRFSDSWIDAPFDVFNETLNYIIQEQEMFDSTRVSWTYDNNEDKYRFYIKYAYIRTTFNSYVLDNYMIIIDSPNRSKYNTEKQRYERLFSPDTDVNAIAEIFEATTADVIFNAINNQVRNERLDHPKGAFLSAFSRTYIDILFKKFNYTTISPYLGESEIQELNTELLNTVCVGDVLSVERKKNFVCGNQALYLKNLEGYLGYLPNDFGPFLCTGIDSGLINVTAVVTKVNNLSSKPKTIKETSVLVKVSVECLNNEKHSIQDLSRVEIKPVFENTKQVVKDYLIRDYDDLYLVSRSNDNVIDISKTNISHFSDPYDSNSVTIPKNISNISMGICFGKKVISVYDTITPNTFGTLNTFNGLPNSNVGWIAIKPNPGYILSISERNSDWEPHTIIVRSSETDQIKYKVWMNREGEPREYYCRLASSWGDRASFDFSNVDKEFKSLKRLEDKARYALYRLQYPYELSNERKSVFGKYLVKNTIGVIDYCISEKDVDLLKEFADFIDINKIDKEAINNLVNKSDDKMIRDYLLSYL